MRCYCTIKDTNRAGAGAQFGVPRSIPGTLTKSGTQRKRGSTNQPREPSSGWEWNPGKYHKALRCPGRSCLAEVGSLKGRAPTNSATFPQGAEGPPGPTGQAGEPVSMAPEPPAWGGGRGDPTEVILGSYVSFPAGPPRSDRPPRLPRPPGTPGEDATCCVSPSGCLCVHLAVQQLCPLAFLPVPLAVSSGDPGWPHLMSPPVLPRALPAVMGRLEPKATW